ncbi:MAG: AEC family transporter [Aquincola sp.]|nr:AEC family transporter [Aquincola sp.]MDH4287113.1 AEC family transporter [Aquincola sp.]MDH5328711.1 AEC family transporter [Aquincola sp.]
MTLAVAYKLLAVALTVLLGYAAGRMRWLGSGTDASDPARVLSNAAFYIFIPALLFRTTARLDFATLPGPLVTAYFGPVALWLLGTYLWHRRHDAGAAPSVRAITVTFGNTVQLGIPLAAAVFGETGLALHIALVSVHALILLSLATALVERDLAHGASWHAQLISTLRNTVIHPVVLPVLAGMAWNLTGLGLHPIADEVLSLLGSAVIPLCLVLIGISLAYYGVAGRWRAAFGFSFAKLVVLPALVLLVARWGFGITGLPLAVIVVMAALPVGSNPLIFAQRYRVLEGEVTAAIVVSTVSFVATLALWLSLLALLAPARA